MTRVEALNELRFWQVGSLAGRYLPVFWQTAPFMLLGLVVALGAGRALNGLALGEDVARALGQRVRRTRAVMFVTVAVLWGAATAACGPITFLGLVVPTWPGSPAVPTTAGSCPTASSSARSCCWPPTSPAAWSSRPTRSRSVSSSA